MGFPICLVEIHGQDESFELSSSAAPFGTSPTSDLIEVKTDKSLSAERPAGAFEIRLVRRKDDDRGRTWMDKIRPQNVVVIQMMNHQGPVVGQNGAGEMHTVMIGLVDTVTETTGITSRGVPQRQVVVRGRDMGKVFTHGIVTYWSFMGASFLGLKEFMDPSKFNDKPDQVIQRLLQDIYQRFMQINLLVEGQSESFWDYLGYQLQSYGSELPLGLDYSFLMGEGSFWSFFVKAASLPFHELFVDTRRSREASNAMFMLSPSLSSVPTKTLGKDRSSPVLFLRQTPFPYLTPPPIAGQTPASTQPLQVTPDLVLLHAIDTVKSVRSAAWEDLIQHEVGSNDLAGEAVDDGVSRSDAEQYNTFMVFPHFSLLPERQFLLNVPVIVDEARFHKYGFKPLMPHTTLLKAPGYDALTDPMIQFYLGLSWRLASWHLFNDTFLSGYKTFKLLPHVHIGERLLDGSTWKESPTIFYIESVSHHFVQNEKATTTLGLTRGLSQSDYDQYAAFLLQSNLSYASGDQVRQQWINLTTADVPS